MICLKSEGIKYKSQNAPYIFLRICILFRNNLSVGGERRMENILRKEERILYASIKRKFNKLEIKYQEEDSLKK